MNLSLYTAVSAVRSANTKVEAISNNIANINTVGYKAQRVAFEDLLYEQVNQTEAVNREGRLTPLGYQYGHGVRVNEITRDMKMGNVTETNIPHNIALEGPGMFQLLVSHPEAARLGVSQEAMDEYDNDMYGYVFTRDGNFRIDTRNGYSSLVDPRGYQVSDVYGNPIEFNATVESFRIDRQGRLFLNDDTTPFTQLMLVGFNNPQALHHAGNNIYVEGKMVEGNYRTSIDNPELLQATAFLQGYIESSNVDMTEQMTELITAQRMLQFGARAVQSSDAIMGMANSLRA